MNEQMITAQGLAKTYGRGSKKADGDHRRHAVELIGKVKTTLNL